MRRGMCPACYQRWRRGTVPTDGRCVACGCHDQRVLRALPLREGGKVTVCYNCAHIVGRATPKPATVAELRDLTALPGERRTGSERRRDDRRGAESVSFGQWDRRSSSRRAADRPSPA